MAIQLEGNIEALRIYEYLIKVLSTGDLSNYYLLIDKQGDQRATRVSLASLLAFSGSQFYDNLFKLISNLDDDELTFVLDNLTANRTITVQDKSIILAGLDDITVENLSTTETNTALVFSPDGLGGVEARTESGGGISDAPSDGKIYGRKNSAWAETVTKPEVIGADLGSISFSSVVVDESGYYDDESISAYQIITFAAAGHDEGRWQKVKLTISSSILYFDGTLNFSANIDFENGVTVLNGTYFLWMQYLGGKLHVTLQEVLVYTPSSLITALELDSTIPQYAVKNAASGITFGDSVTDSPFSISMDFKLNDISAIQRLFALENYAANQYWWDVRIYNDGTFALHAYDGSGAVNIYARTDNPLSYGVKYRLVLTYTGSGLASGFKNYVNGVLVASTPVTVGSYTAMHGDNGNQNLYVGIASSLLQPTDGLLDNLMIWNTELTLANVVELYHGGGVYDVKTHSKYSANCVSLFEFSNNLNDTKGSNNLTGVGSPTYASL